MYEIWNLLIAISSAKESIEGESNTFVIALNINLWKCEKAIDDSSHLM